MSLLINENLIWVATPKCASIAIENALYSSNLNIKPSKWIESHNNRHLHIPIDFLKKEFGNKQSICIRRDWFEKWLSALNHLWDVIETQTPFELICEWENVDNEFIYKLFNTDFLNNLHLTTFEGYTYCFNKLILNNELTTEYKKEVGWMATLISEKYFKNNQKCTYEFDIKEIDKFASFIEERFGEKLIIETINSSPKRKNKIIVNDELKQFVWDSFEKRFEKNIRLI